MNIIDFRSDTVTMPTEKMREVMASALVGDDVYREDPTVNALEEIAAKRLGKETALFVPSGTMGNQIAVKTHTIAGHEVIVENKSHIYNYEVGALASICGVQAHPISSDLGAINPDFLREAIREEDIHYAKTGLICLENTHNQHGGIVVPIENMKTVYEIAQENQIPIHLDGARIFNAATYLKTDVKNIAEYADSIMLCLSKGLGAPVGSILVGNREFIQKARKVRKMFGGGMRQAGIIAAAGIVSLEEMTHRLEEDHITAKALGEGLSEINGLKVDLKTLQTNIVMCDVINPQIDTNQLVEDLRKEGIICATAGVNRIRFVTHYPISMSDVHYTMGLIGKVVRIT
ncbi:low-specificity L-threonine aldolase [Alkalibaculum bacchi]|uniref:low-specificity L-threonine aldolase n=1 Tax=Alkalibaculum bacchi TaxID=645887 RepID=UPI0026EDD1E9|nr:low-specificity L-threonine aldolase [Alkalibaculum bacchi]